MGRVFTAGDNLVDANVSQLLTDWTIFGWYNPAALNTRFLTSIATSATSEVRVQSVQMGGNGTFNVTQDMSTTDAVGNSTSGLITANEWQLLAANFDSTTKVIRLYRGTLSSAMAEPSYGVQTTGVGTMVATGDALILGTAGTGNSSTYTGSLERYGVIRKKLTVDQLEYIRLGGNPLWLGVETDWMLYWPLDSPTVSQIQDLSGSAEHGTNNGTAVGEGPPIPTNFTMSFNFGAAALTPIDVAIGQAQETDTANPFRHGRIGQAQETDTANPFVAYKAGTTPIGQAQETDTANPFSISRDKLIGQAQETDLAFSFTPVKEGVTLPSDQFREFDAVLDGLGLMLIEQEDTQAYVFGAPDGVVERTDLSDQLTENRLDKMWWGSNRSWHEGAGQKRLQVPDVSSPSAFFDSKGVEVSEKGRATLLHRTARIVSNTFSARPMDMVVANDALFVVAAAPNLIKVTDLAGTQANFDTGGGTTDVRDLATDGANVYIALGDHGVHRITPGQVAPATHWSDAKMDIVEVAKSTVFGTGLDAGSGRYQLMELDAGAASDQIFLFPAGDVPVAMTELGRWLYVGVQSGDSVSRIYAYDGENGPFVAWSLPPGDLVTGFTPFNGAGMLVGAKRYQGPGLSTSIVYIGFPAGTGHLTVAERELVALGTAQAGRDYSVRNGVQWRNQVFFPWSYDDACGLGAFLPETASYYRHLYAVDGASDSVSAVAVWRGRLMFSVKGTGVYCEQTTYVPNGFITSSLIDINIDAEKSWLVQESGFDPLPSGTRVDHEYSINGTTFLDPYSQAVSGEKLLRTPRNVVATQIQYRVTLFTDGPAMLTPTLVKSGLGGWPTGAAQPEHKLFVRSYTSTRTRTGQTGRHDSAGWELFSELLDRRNTKKAYNYQPPWWLHSEQTLRVRVAAVEFAGPWGHNGPLQGGVVVLTLQEV